MELMATSLKYHQPQDPMGFMGDEKEDVQFGNYMIKNFVKDMKEIVKALTPATPMRSQSWQKCSTSTRNLSA